MVANVIATIMVVAIHYTAYRDVEPVRASTLNYLLQEILVNGLSRVAVPFFVMAAGFFFYRGWRDVATSYLPRVSRRIESLLIPYLLTSLIVFVCWFAFQMRFNNHVWEMTWIDVVWHLTVEPKVPQLWFLRDLILLVAISPLLAPVNKTWSAILGCVLFTFWFWEIHPLPEIGRAYLINDETLFFFWIGGVLSRCEDKLSDFLKTPRYIAALIVCIWLILIGARVWVDPLFDSSLVRNYTPTSLALQKASILVGVPALLLVSGIERLAPLSRLQVYSFFVYLFHTVPVIYVVDAVVERLVRGPLSFYISFISAAIITTLIGAGLRRYAPRAYDIVTGGRTSRQPKAGPA